MQRLHASKARRAAAKNYWPCVWACAQEHTNFRGNTVVRGMDAGQKAVNNECEASCRHLPVSTAKKGKVVVTKQRNKGKMDVEASNDIAATLPSSLST